MDRRSGPTTRAAPRAQRDLHLESALESNRTNPTDAGPKRGADHLGFSQKQIGLGRVAQPNGSRLSCGADLKCSQTEFYYTGFPDVHRIP